MSAQTIFDRGGFANRPRMRTAQSPFLRQLVPQRRSAQQNTIVQKPLPRPERAILLGDQIHPDTGQFIGKAYLPLPSVKGANEAIMVYGESGAGKSIVMRSLIEYFSIVEGRCVIIFDPTKNQYWSLKYPQNRTNMIRTLKKENIEPIGVPEVDVYVPVYDAPVIGIQSIIRDFHSSENNLISIKTSGLTAQGFFELGDVDPSGKVYQNYLYSILNIKKSERTVDHIKNELDILMSDSTKRRSVASLKNLFEPLTQQGIIADDGTDVKRMLHPPRKDRPGKISVISMATSSANDRRKNALVSSICQQLFDYMRDNLALRPVIVIDESKEYVGRDRYTSSPATISGFSRIHLQGRAWGRTLIYGFQNTEDVQGFITSANTPISIRMTKSLFLANNTRINDTGLGHVFINGIGDPKIPDMNFLVKFFPCRSKHID